MSYPTVAERTVLVTGCSSGIGYAAAHELHRRGWKVIASVRTERDSARLVEQGLSAVQIDLADSTSVQRAADEVLQRFGGSLGGLVNNAGFGQAGAAEDLSREALRQQFEVNVFGLQELTNCFVPQMRRQGYGRIVNISSVLGRVSLPFNGAYSASKFALEALSSAMRVELRGSGIAVSLIEPGPIVTRFADNSTGHIEQNLDMAQGRHAGHYRELIKQRKGAQGAPSGSRFSLPPEAVSRRIVHALESTRPRIRYCVTLPAHIGAWLSRFAPAALLDRLLSRSST